MDLELALWRKSRYSPDGPAAACLGAAAVLVRQDGTYEGIPGGVAFTPGASGLARVEDPVASRLQPGVAIVVRPDEAAYATRDDGGARDLTVRRPEEAPGGTADASAGGAGRADAGEPQAARLRLGKDSKYRFERRLEAGTSSASPWVSYTVTAGRPAVIVLDNGESVPGEGWYRHGPLFLHPGEDNGYTETGEPGWVLFGDTGWIGRISNTDELFVDSELPGMFNPAMASRYEVSATFDGMYLAPADNDEQSPTIYLPWRETSLSQGGPAPQPSATEQPARIARDAGLGHDTPGRRRQEHSAGEGSVVRASRVPRLSLGDEPGTVEETVSISQTPAPDGVLAGGQDAVIADSAVADDDPASVGAGDSELSSGAGAGRLVAQTPDSGAEAFQDPGADIYSESWETGTSVSETGMSPAAEAGAEVSRVGFGGLPGGTSLNLAGWARSFGLDLVLAGAGVYEAVVASGGSVAVDGEQVSGVAQLRLALHRKMSAVAVAVDKRPRWAAAFREAVVAKLNKSPEAIDTAINDGSAWEYMQAAVKTPDYFPELDKRIAGLVVAEYMDMALLVPGADGRPELYGSDMPKALLTQTAAPGVSPSWIVMRPRVAGRPVFGPISAPQVRRAADEGMVFFGSWGGGGNADAEPVGGDFFAAAMAAAVAAGLRAPLESVLGPLDVPGDLRGSLALRTVPGDWADIAQEYEAARLTAKGVGPVAGDRSPSESRADAEVWQEIIAGVQSALPDDPARRVALNQVAPRLVSGAPGLAVRVLRADGQVELYGEGAHITVAEVAGDGPGSPKRWVGLGPLLDLRLLGASTRPAAVAGGWSEPHPIEDPAGRAAGGPVGSDGLSTEQLESMRRNRLVVDSVPVGEDHSTGFPGADGLLTAIVRVGDLYVKDQIVRDAEDLRHVLLDTINQQAARDLDRWLVFKTFIKVLYPAWTLPPLGWQGLTPQQIDDRLTPDTMRYLVHEAIADPRFWPELAQEVVPYLLELTGLALRVIDIAGAMNRYGDGRPVYVAEVGGADVGPRMWVPLRPIVSEYSPTSPLNAPNLSDPVLVRLAKAVDAPKDVFGATGSEPGPVVDFLRGVRKRWVRHGDEAQITATGTSDGAQWTPDRLTSEVTKLVGQTPDPGRGGDALRTGLVVSLAVRLAEAVISVDQGGIRPEPVKASDEVRRPSGIPADQWVKAPLGGLIDGFSRSGAAVALFLHEKRASVAVMTSEGLRLAVFDPAEPAKVIAPSPDQTDSASPAEALALFVGSDGKVIPAGARLPGFEPATGWTDEPAAVPMELGQELNDWSRAHEARVLDPQQGTDAIYVATMDALDDPLLVNGSHVTDSMGLHQALIQFLQNPKVTDWLRSDPYVRAVYNFEAEHRVTMRYHSNDPTTVDAQAVRRQVEEHWAESSTRPTRTAQEYIQDAVAEPGEWAAVAEQLIPRLLAKLIGRPVVVVASDGNVLVHGDPAGRPVVLARIGAAPGALSSWAAVRPMTPDQTASPFEDISTGSVVVPLDEHTAPGEPEPAILNHAQQRTADNEELLPGPPEQDFSDAFLTGNGGGFLLKRHVYVNTKRQLVQEVGKLRASRPDIFPDADELDTETDGDIRQAIVSDLGFELRVIGFDGAIKSEGTGPAITVAPTSRDGQMRWVALRHQPPATPQTSLSGLLPRLPDRAELDRQTRTRWSPHRFNRIPLGAPQKETGWVSASFCKPMVLPDGREVLACVSVAVVHLHAGQTGVSS